MDFSRKLEKLLYNLQSKKTETKI